MSGISKLLRPGQDQNLIELNDGGLLYSLALSTVGVEHREIWQPPVWTMEKNVVVPPLLRLPALGFCCEDEMEPRVRFYLPLLTDGRAIVADTVNGTQLYTPVEGLPASRGAARFLAPAELTELRVPRHERALYYAFAIAEFLLDPDDDFPGVGLLGFPEWTAAAIRYVGELFGSACYFRRVRDSQVLVIQIDHDADELEILREYASGVVS